MINEAEARRIAQGYHSPSPHDDQITRLSHGMPVTDWPRLRSQVARELGAAPEPDDELFELLAWVESHPEAMAGMPGYPDLILVDDITEEDEDEADVPGRQFDQMGWRMELPRRRNEATHPMEVEDDPDPIDLQDEANGNWTPGSEY